MGTDPVVGHPGQSFRRRSQGKDLADLGLISLLPACVLPVPLLSLPQLHATTYDTVHP